MIGAVNTTRYNTISFKAEIYQDTSPIIDKWNSAINKVENSQDISAKFGKDSESTIYIAFIDLLNNTSCVLGQESECEFKGHNLNNLNKSTHTFSNLINQNDRSKVNEVSWLNYPGLNNTTYNQQGNYDESGNLKIMDSGPSNFDSLLKSFLS